MVAPTMQAAELLQVEGVSARVLDMFCLKPVDTEAICKAAQETKAIVTVEEHSIYGGLGELVCAVVAENYPVPVKVLGFPDDECKIGTSAELFNYYGFTPENIANWARKLIERKVKL